MNTYFIVAICNLAIGAAPCIAGVVKLARAFLNEDARAKVRAQKQVRISILTFPVWVAAAAVLVLCGIFL